MEHETSRLALCHGSGDDNMRHSFCAASRLPVWEVDTPSAMALYTVSTSSLTVSLSTHPFNLFNQFQSISLLQWYPVSFHRWLLIPSRHHAALLSIPSRGFFALLSAD